MPSTTQDTTIGKEPWEDINKAPSLKQHNEVGAKHTRHQARHQETFPKEPEPQEVWKHTLQKCCRKGEHHSDPPEPQQVPTGGGAKTAEKCRQTCNKSERRRGTDTRPKSKKRWQAQQDEKQHTRTKWPTQSKGMCIKPGPERAKHPDHCKETNATKRGTQQD